MRLLSATLLLALASACPAQTVYKWVDEHGRTQYSQTPPPPSVEDVSERQIGEGGAPPPAGYCLAIRDFALTLSQAMARGVPLESAIAAARHAEQILIDAGAAEAQVREVAYFVYGMQSGYRAQRVTTAGIAELAHARCQSGNFAAIRGLPGTGGADGSDRSGAGARSGTGWFIRRGAVVTSLHVVSGAKQITLFLADGGSAEATILDTDPANDLAVLSTPATHVPGLAVRDGEVGIGAAVFTIGFPHADVMGVKPKLADGVVSSVAGLRDDPASYQISVPVQAGNSGGPLLDMQGRVVGVVSAKLRAGRMLQRTGDLTENVNYAIKSTFVGKLAGFGDGDAAGGAGALEAVARGVEGSVVRIVAD